MDTTIKDMTEEQVNDLEKQIKEYRESKTKTKTIYNTDMWDDVYCVVWNWNIFLDNSDNSYNYINQWNAFLTLTEAQKESSKMKARATIKKWSVENASDYQFVRGNDNYYIVLDTDNWELKINHSRAFKTNSQYYSSKEKAEQAKEELEEEYRILFN